MTRAACSLSRALCGAGTSSAIPDAHATLRGMNGQPPDPLDAWITELRGRVARGELAGLGPVDVGGFKLPGERAARIMLADLVHLDTLPAKWARDPLVPVRRAKLLADFRWLREQIG